MKIYLDHSVETIQLFSCLKSTDPLASEGACHIKLSVKFGVAIVCPMVVYRREGWSGREGGREGGRKES